MIKLDNSVVHFSAVNIMNAIKKNKVRKWAQTKVPTSYVIQGSGAWLFRSLSGCHQLGKFLTTPQNKAKPVYE